MSKTTYLEETAPESFDSDASLRAVASKLLESLDITTEPAEVARLSAAFIAASAEMRQREKAVARAIASFPLDQVIAHLKSLSDRAKRDLCREVLGQDDEEPLL